MTKPLALIRWSAARKAINASNNGMSAGASGYAAPLQVSTRPAPDVHVPVTSVEVGYVPGMKMDNPARNFS